MKHQCLYGQEDGTSKLRQERTRKYNHGHRHKKANQEKQNEFLLCFTLFKIKFDFWTVNSITQ